MEHDERKNKEGYTDETPYKVINQEERRRKSFYVFKTMISAARLAGFYINDNLIIEDNEGNKYHSNEILKAYERKRNV